MSFLLRRDLAQLRFGHALPSWLDNGYGASGEGGEGEAPVHRHSRRLHQVVHNRNVSKIIIVMFLKLLSSHNSVYFIHLSNIVKLMPIFRRHSLKNKFSLPTLQAENMKKP